MIPCFFGDARHQLYGVYHPATGATTRRTGVVLCYPGPQEYRQAHWVYRRLAALLSERGVHVLRFDYYATGDSAGASPDGRLAHWVRDVRTATEELQDLAGIRRASLVGMRLGAAVAARAAADVDVVDLVLWDPVVRGTDYLAALDAEHAAGLRDRIYPVDGRTAPDEVLGFVLPEPVREEIATVDLTVDGCGRPARVLIVAADEEPGYGVLDTALRARGIASEFRHVPDVTLARGGHLRSDTLMARHIPGAIADFVVGR